MIFSTAVEAEIVRTIGSISFAPADSTCLTPELRADQLAKAVRKLLRVALTTNKVAFSCRSCAAVEYLDPAHETPMHRHGTTLVVLTQKVFRRA